MNKKSSRVMLNVPYSEKDEAKELGAWWDAELKKWFVPSGIDAKPFEKWIESKSEEQRA